VNGGRVEVFCSFVVSLSNHIPYFCKRLIFMTHEKFPDE
jgi:hypothetical protein